MNEDSNVYHNHEQIIDLTLRELSKTRTYQMEMQKQINSIKEDIHNIDKKIEMNHKDTENKIALYHKDNENYAQMILEHSQRLATLPDVLNRLNITLTQLTTEHIFSNNKIDKIEKWCDNHEAEVKENMKSETQERQKLEARISKLENFRYYLLGGLGILLLVLKLTYGF